jgi:ABC-2 type transport system permease protein
MPAVADVTIEDPPIEDILRRSFARTRPPPVRRLLRAYGALLRASWAKALEYRAQVVLWVISGIFPLVMMAVWLAVVDEAGPVSGWGRVDFISYYVGAAVVLQFTGSWVLWDWDDDIRLGSLSLKLVKPLDPVHHFLTDMLGFKLFVLAVLVPVVSLIAWLSPDISYALTPARAALFALACLAGLAVSTLMATAFAMISFWSTQSSNVFSLVFGVGQFLSGWMSRSPSSNPASARSPTGSPTAAPKLPPRNPPRPRHRRRDSLRLRHHRPLDRSIPDHLPPPLAPRPPPLRSRRRLTAPMEHVILHPLHKGHPLPEG